MFEMWKWFVDNGLIRSDPNALATGKHADGNPVTEAEYREALNAIMGHIMAARQPGSGYNPAFPEEATKRLRAAGLLVADREISYWARESGADEIAGFLDVVTPRAVSGAAPTAGAPQVPTTPHPAEPGAPAAPVVGTPTGVLKGGKTVKVQAEDGTYRWYQVYMFPPGSNQYVAYQYNNVQQVEAAQGGVPPHELWGTKQFNILTQGGSVASAEEVIGMAGDWNNFSQEVMRDAAAKAGISDPTIIGKMWSDPQMQQIAAKARIEGWTPEQILAEQRKTDFWKNTLYPGIDQFYGRTTEPEKAWTDYSANVSPTLEALGYQRGADGTFNTQIKTMLDKKISDDAFNSMAPTFVQARQNTDFFQVLNARAQNELGKSLTFGDWFGLLAGETTPDVQKVAEGAVVAYQAQQQKVGLNEQTLQRLIAERDLSEAEARNLFSDVNQAVLATGDAGLGRYGLSRDDIISSAAGIDPESGRSASEVRNLVAKIAQENALFDDEKIGFYLGFDPTGRPTRPGLQALAPEGA